MGVAYSKVIDSQLSMGMSCPLGAQSHFVDPDHVGETYIVVCKRHAIHRKLAQHAIAVDVAGALNESELCGVPIHLNTNSLTKISSYRVEDNYWERTDFYEVIRISCLLPTQLTPRHWAFNL
jgi:hypothetical protein